MAVYFFDSSALVKRYVQESGADWVLSVCNASVDANLYIARITGPEVVAAIARRGRAGDMAANDVIRAIDQYLGSPLIQYTWSHRRWQFTERGKR